MTEAALLFVGCLIALYAVAAAVRPMRAADPFHI